MTKEQAARLERRIAARWPEAEGLQVDAMSDGALVTMRLDGGWQFLRVTPDGPLLRFLLARRVQGRKPGEAGEAG